MEQQSDAVVAGVGHTVDARHAVQWSTYSIL